MKNTDKFRRMWVRSLLWTHRYVPTGLRTVAGIALIFGGVLGFLPILGFWMIPLGLAVIALDAKVISKRLQRATRSRKKHAIKGREKQDSEDEG